MDNMTRDAYRNKMQTQLNEWEAEINLLRARAENATADERVALSQEVYDLQNKHAGLRTQLDRLGDAAEDAWDNLRQGVEDAVIDLRANFEKLKSRLS